MYKSNKICTRTTSGKLQNSDERNKDLNGETLCVRGLDD